MPNSVGTISSRRREDVGGHDDGPFAGEPFSVRLLGAATARRFSIAAVALAGSIHHAVAREAGRTAGRRPAEAVPVGDPEAAACASSAPCTCFESSTRSSARVAAGSSSRSARVDDLLDQRVDHRVADAGVRCAALGLGAGAGPETALLVPGADDITGRPRPSCRSRRCPAAPGSAPGRQRGSCASMPSRRRLCT